MAVSCSIHLAEVAQQSANWHTAFHTFQSIIKNYPEPQYAFYVAKANLAIEQFSSVRPASLSSQDALVR
jgi:outer membrane protein assembly factor BamD (BamD/ComL family)